ncbi:MAG: CHAT domain-containing protein [Pseudomonas sp.]|uniref:CHAT domain-containing protein n=1 Tax=unclassified Pseudomonas TaxID=196821 RepID=UPI001BCB2DF7|nr:MULTISPECIES: CHAT domain-containing protein [unclassified Pseudomonas]QVM98857.1 CHAT domain-containing protein [Pseudomonas sp. SORT22]UVM64748.1 CHAT domain-containing protein [Pseudomonas sp. B21-009]
MPKNEYCELELRLAWHDESSYLLDARFMNPSSDTENELVAPVRITFDMAQLRDAVLDAERYGTLLTHLLFSGAGSPLREAYVHARIAAARQHGLRVRLNIQSSAPELHALRWETLQDPDDNSRLLVQENVWFSRFLSARDFRWQPRADSGEISTLVVVANPDDLNTRWNLAAIDSAAELARVTNAVKLGEARASTSIQIRTLDKPASVFNIATALKHKYADVLYIICHGAITSDGKPRLLLEKEDKTSHFIEGKELVERIRDMDERPRLIILASCASAGDEHAGALTAIGPSLAAAGVPAVIAMQGAITQRTSAMFISTLFEELACHGQIDRAVAAARSQVRGESDWWMPVLFMRLRSGRLWPAFAQPDAQFDRWKSIVTDVAKEKCVPILGPGLVESTLGSMGNIAKKWAQLYEFPLAPQHRDRIEHVAQYLKYRQSPNVVVAELQSYLISHIRERYKEQLAIVEDDQGERLRNGKDSDQTLNELMAFVGRHQRQQHKEDVHRLLARLPVPIYINANRDNFLRDALIEAGKQPQIALCTWVTNNNTPQFNGPSLPKKYKPSVAEPLIFYVYGSLEYTNSLVITEDDYFDFLMAVTRNERSQLASIPGAVSSALASQGALLLGFQPDDWDFRVLLKGILMQPGSSLNGTRVAVQVSPREGLIIDPDRASDYLAKYFIDAHQGKLHVFWGSAQAFIQSLTERCIEQGVIPPDA